MRKITNKRSLDLEIEFLKREVKAKELLLSEKFEKISESLEPGAILSNGIKSIFRSDTTKKTLLSTGVSLLAGIIIEKIILKKSNFLVKYGVAQLVMGLINKISTEDWQPEILQNIKSSLNKILLKEEEEEDNELFT